MDSYECEGGHKVISSDDDSSSSSELGEREDAKDKMADKRPVGDLPAEGKSASGEPNKQSFAAALTAAKHKAHKSIRWPMF